MLVRITFTDGHSSDFETDNFTIQSDVPNALVLSTKIGPGHQDHERVRHIFPLTGFTHFEVVHDDDAI